jgi:NitT/TauT family transport system substrate-binding protein
MSHDGGLLQEVIALRTPHAAVVMSLLIGVVVACAFPPSAAPAAPAPATVAVAVPTAVLPTAIPAATTAPAFGVRMGAVSSASDAGLWIGLAKGYFEQAGLQIEQVPFTTAADMIAPLSAGQLDVGGGAPGVALANAFLRGLDLRIVADKGNSGLGHGFGAVVARKDLYDRGEIRGPADLKGRRYAMASTTGNIQEAVLDRYMQRAGLHARDADLVALSFADMVPGFANKVIDAATAVEPFATQIIEAGDVAILERGDTIFPDHQDAVLLYSAAFAQQREAAVRFMTAYLRGVRDYNDAFVKQQPARRAEVIDIMTQSTPVKDRALYERMAMPGLDPNGRVNLASLNADQDYYLEAGLQQTPVEFERVVDPSFATAAVQQLGAYQ